MTTALDLITGAARLLGVARKGEALDGDEATDGLSALNAMLASWGSENLMALALIRESFTLTSAASYTIGVGKTLNTVNPIAISNAFIRIGTVDYPLSEITDAEYDNITLKDVSGIPFVFNFSNSATEEAATIRLYPSPSAGYELHLLSEKPFATLTLTTNIFFPQRAGERAARYNLAVEMAPEFGVEPSAAVVAIARESKGLMKLETAKSRKMRSIDVWRGVDYKGPYG